MGDFYSLCAWPELEAAHEPHGASGSSVDWYDGDAVREPFDDGADSNQLMFGLDAILFY